MSTVPVCSHCQLPVGRLAQQREIDGTGHWFCCYGCCLAYQVHHGSGEEPEAAYLLIRLGLGGFFAMNIMLLSLLLYADAFSGADAWLVEWIPWVLWALATPVLVVLGGPFLRGAWQSARRGRLTADSLVSLAALAAYLFSGWQVIQGTEQVYFDTVTMVLVLFTLGRYLEAQGRVRAVRSLAPMLAAERAEVKVLRAEGEVVQPIHEVRVGDLVRILPGERIAVDGDVVDGCSECDESIRTGQPEPRSKVPGEPVHAGSLNGTGPLLVRATAAGNATSWMRIGGLVREALARKSLVGEAVDRVVAYFIPGVLVLALATVGLWAVRGSFDQALLAGLAVLVVACPCALGLAAPLVTSIAIGQAAERGILIRSGRVLEGLARLKGVAFDKTGTLTLGKLRPVSVTVDDAEETAVLGFARALALGSDHPVARAVVARAEGIDAAAIPAARDVRAHAGAGVAGRVGRTQCAIGSVSLMTELGWSVPVALLPTAAREEHSAVYVGWGGRVHGRLAFADTPRGEARRVVSLLLAWGLQPLLLSGDGQGAVARLAESLDITSWHAELTPEDKAEIVADWARRRGPIAMVGDGLNDGPVLAAATVGIAVGGGTDLAKESADVILPDAGLASLPWLVHLARDVRRSVRINLLWAFGYNAVTLTLAVSGLLQPVIAAALMAGSSLLVVGRTLYAGRRQAGAREQRRAFEAERLTRPGEIHAG